MIVTAYLWARQAFDIVANGELQTIACQTLFCQINGESICHLPDNKACLLWCIRILQYLSHMCAARLWTVVFDVLHARAFISPRMIDQQLCLDPEEAVEKVFIMP